MEDKVEGMVNLGEETNSWNCKDNAPAKEAPPDDLPEKADVVDTHERDSKQVKKRWEGCTG